MMLAQQERGTMNLPGGIRAERGAWALHLTGFSRKPWAPVLWQASAVHFGPFILRMTPSEGAPGDGIRTQEVPVGMLEGCEIRTRRPGDRIRPFGMKGYRKLQDYLTDRRIDAAWREEIPLLCKEGEVLLAGGVGAGGIPSWRKSEDVVRLTWVGDMPWTGKKGRR